MPSYILGVRVAIETVDADGEPEHIEATLAYEPADADAGQEVDALELRLPGGLSAAVPLPVVWEALRLLDALPEGRRVLAGEGNGDA